MKFLELFGKIHTGGTTDEEAEFVCSLAKGRIIELGCWLGNLSYRLAKCGELWAVDDFTSAERTVDSFSVKFYKPLEIFKANMDYNKSDYKLIIGDTIKVANNFEDGFFDFVYIDANHDYENVKKDILAWKGKVKKGGILAGHDYSNKFGDGVIRAVDELLPNSIKQGRIWYQKL